MYDTIFVTKVICRMYILKNRGVDRLVKKRGKKPTNLTKIDEDIYQILSVNNYSEFPFLANISAEEKPHRNGSCVSV